MFLISSQAVRLERPSGHRLVQLLDERLLFLRQLVWDLSLYGNE